VKLKAAVKAGKLTEEEAKAKWAAIKKAAHGEKGDAKDKNHD
jgi:polyhydroxyalkanoate synthesis regulator phasin